MPLCVDDMERKRVSYTLTETATATKQVEAHGRPVALLRPLIVRKLVALLRPLPACERATILAQAVREGEADVALLPIENSTAGSINETYDLLADGGLSITAEVVSRVEHCLLALPGAQRPR